MAKKPENLGPGRPKAGEDLKLPLASFKGKPPFKDWFVRLQKHTRLTGSTLIEFALIEYAERHGFDEKAPER